MRIVRFREWFGRGDYEAPAPHVALPRGGVDAAAAQGGTEGRPSRDGAPLPPSLDPSGTWWRAAKKPLGEPARDLMHHLAARGVSIERTCARFPHVGNRLAAAWHDPVLLADVFVELLVDRRGGRQGFPPEVLQELLSLWAKCEPRLPKRRIGPWEQVQAQERR